MEHSGISVVLPFAEHESIVGDVARRLHARLSALGTPFEIVAVDLGSRDNSQAILGLLANELPQLRVVMGRGILAGVAESRSEILLLSSIARIHQGVPSLVDAALQDALAGEVLIERVAQEIVVCKRSLALELLRGNSLSGWERKLLRRARKRKLPVRGITDGPIPHSMGRLLGALAPRMLSSYRA